MTTRTKDELDLLSSKELVNIYNQFSPRPLKGWDKAKSLLVERILQLQAQVPAQEPVPAESKVRKPRKAKEPKEPRGPAKWEQMLDALVQGPKTVQELAEAIDSSIGSVGCYLNYFRTGKRGIPMAAISKRKEEDRGYVYSLNEDLRKVMARVER